MKPQTLEATIIARHNMTLAEFSALLFAPDTVAIVGDLVFMPAQTPRPGSAERPRRGNKRGGGARAVLRWIEARRAAADTSIQTPPQVRRQPASAPKAAPATGKASEAKGRTHSPNELVAYVTTRYRAMVTKYPAARGITRKAFIAWAQGPHFAKLYAAFLASGRKSWLTPTAYLKDPRQDWRIDNLTWLTRAALRKQETWALNRKLAER
jgi:hypothetical protein